MTENKWKFENEWEINEIKEKWKKINEIIWRNENIWKLMRMKMKENKWKFENELNKWK